jgi:hypothetical protein
MAGETDLTTMLRTLSVSVRPGSYTLVTVDEPVELGAGVDAALAEDEGTTVVVSVHEAHRRGWPVDFEGAWLTLDVHSSLHAVGLTAAVSAALVDEGIPANMLAGYHHDHILVPVERTDDAVQALARLVERS